MTPINSAIVFGATRGVGLHLCEHLRRAGAKVAALVRPTSDIAALKELGVELIVGDAMVLDDVRATYWAHGPADLVVSTLSGGTGPKNRVDDIANINVIDGAKEASVGRFIFITSIGCGEMRPTMSERMLEIIGDALLAKTIAEEHLKKSALNWTIIRPGGLISEAATENGALYLSSDIHGMIHREDVALLTIAAAKDATTIRKVYAALDQAQVRSAHPPNPTPALSL